MIFCISLAHHNQKQLEGSFEAFYSRLSGLQEIKHLVLDQHYPLRYDAVRNTLEFYRNRFGFELLDRGKNLGLSAGLNALIERCRAIKGGPLDSNDLVIGYDLDSNPVSPGWDMALTTCFVGDHRTAWATLYGQWLVGQMHFIERKINQLRVHETRFPIMNSVCMWRGSFLEFSKGIHEPGTWYGGLEIEMWKYLERYKGKWVFTADYWEDHTLHWLQDEEYKRYKWGLAHLRKFTYSFEEYVRQGCPAL